MEEVTQNDSNSNSVDSINTLWIKNVYENIKKLEEFERFARSGFDGIPAYTSVYQGIPADQRDIFKARTQYQNLQLFYNELLLLLTDLTPIIEETTMARLRGSVESLGDLINEPNNFLTEIYSQVKNKTIALKLKPEYWAAVKMLSKIRGVIIKQIESLLFNKNKQSLNSLPTYIEEYGG